MPIIHDSYNEKAREIHAYLSTRYTPKPHQYIILGGDGFMLKTVQQVQDPQATFLGLNCGRVGFLLNDLPADLPDIVRLLEAEPTIIRFPRIEMTAQTVTGEKHRALALNDVYLERMTGQTAHLRIAINGQTMVEHLVSDGVICCTALGSTAYNYSAGASACHPTLPVLGITAICPHAPVLRPLYVPLEARIEMSVLQHERRPVRAVADGFDHPGVLHIELKNANSPVSFAFLPGHDFTHTLISKLLR